MSPELMEKYKSVSTYIDYPGILLQDSIYNGISSKEEAKAIVIPSLKTELKSSHIYRHLFSWHNSINNVSVDYLNIRGIKELTVPQIVISEIIKIGGTPDVLIIYSLGTIQYTVAQKLKKRFPNIKVISIVADLPQYMSSQQNLLYRLLKSIDGNIVKRKCKYIDGFVLLSQYMREKLPIFNKPWIQMEGIYNQSREPSYTIEKFSEKIVLYTGALESRYGINDLVDAFRMINNPNLKLFLCGPGSSVEYIKNISQIDNRIYYLGILEYSNVLELQQKVSLLVNPRHSSDEYTKYSFPSKTMEYLASGTPTLMCKLKCIPREYDSFLYYFNDESVSGMASRIAEILTKPERELKERGFLGRQFVLNNKNPFYQAGRIIDFINSI